MPGKSSPATKISIFTDENACVCDPLHPPGERAAPPPPPAWCHLAARQLSYLLQPFLTEAPLAFEALERHGWPAGRRKSFASNLTRVS